MKFNNRKLCQEGYQMRPVSYDIRRPLHYPEGVLSIEAVNAKGDEEPIYTTVQHLESGPPMTFTLSSSSHVTFHGSRYLHGYLSHKFQGERHTDALYLHARSRQFSSFILLVGRIGSASSFEPTAGIIIQNKDDLKIPLILETIPTPKEFKDAIQSLSPEQQSFAKKFRNMQLEGTVFGICIIQIKPQLEKLLNLVDDSLTKEISLTQNLMELFIKYQIPSDLLSFTGDLQATGGSDRVSVVKNYVAAMYSMIDQSKQKAIQESRETMAYDIQQSISAEERVQREYNRSRP